MKKICLLLSAVILIPALILSISSCKKKGADTKNVTYKIITHVGTENEYGEMKVTSGNRFELTNRIGETEDGINYTMIAIYTGTVKTDGDIMTCTVEEAVAKCEFASEDDRQAMISEMEEAKNYMGEEEYDMYSKMLKSEYRTKLSEAKDKNMSVPEKIIVKTVKSDAAIINSIRCTDGTGEEYEYYNEETGLVKREKNLNADGSSWTVGYSEEGNIIEYPGG